MTTSARILVPVDLTAPGEAKIPVAEGYAKALGAEVLLLHVLPRNPTLTALEDRRAVRRLASPDNTLDVPSAAEATARAYLDVIATQLRTAGVRVQTIVREGAVVATILEVAAENAVSLLIIGSSVRPRLARLTQDDLAAAIARGAPCPVLLVRPTMAAAAAAPAIRSFTDEATRAGLLVPRMLGLRTVALARIIGSVGKAEELGPDFRPKRRSTLEEQRYGGVRGLSGGALNDEPVVLAPIDLYKLGYGYYVLDGHRRVAAAKELGQDEIEANVTEFVPVNDPDAQRGFVVRRAFERATGLTRIGAANPDTYGQLQTIIAAWNRRHLPDTARREAAERWYAKVFRPQAKRIRALRLNRLFPGDRTADIFVRTAAFRVAESAREGQKIGWEEATHRFAEYVRGAGQPAEAAVPQEGWADEVAE
jgi:nucleotide-binding universal stress UspA family protein